MKNKRIIKGNFEFQNIINQKASFKNQSFVIYQIKSQKGFLEFGISVGKKLGNAVLRNKVKRQIRMMIREVIAEHGDKDKKIIILTRKEFLRKSYQENLFLLKNLINNL